MAKMSSKDKLIKYLNKNLFVTTIEANALGISAMNLSRLVKNGEIFRVEHGVYTHKLDWMTNKLKRYAIPCTKYPGAVVSGISSLDYHNLTDEQEDKIWLAIEPPKTIENQKYRMIRPRGINYSLGIEKYHFGNRTIQIYDKEKSIVDAFKFLWEEIAFKALKGYLKREDRNVKKLCEYGVKLKKPIDNYVTVIQADE